MKLAHLPTIFLGAIINIHSCADAFVSSVQISKAHGIQSPALHVATLPEFTDAELGELPFFASLATANLELFDESVQRIKHERTATVPTESTFLAPLVLTLKGSMGQRSFNTLRGKIISVHSQAIRSFVGTSDSLVGEAVLFALFSMLDADGDGLVHESEMKAGLHRLGFTWLKDEHIQKILARAKVLIPGYISMEEFVQEAPKTLSTNLIKLAKTNGARMGLLA